MELSSGRELSLYVVGVAYPNKDKTNRAFEVAMCKPGEPVELRREPKNPVDPQAVAVYSARGIQIGYLSADRAGWIGGRLAQGVPIVAVFQEGGTERALIRLNLAGEQPTLPPPRPALERVERRLSTAGTQPGHRPATAHDQLPAADFYPDEEGSDWGA